MVRAAMKEPGKTAAKTRETVYFRSSQWKDGKATTNGGHPLLIGYQIHSYQVLQRLHCPDEMGII